MKTYVPGTVVQASDREYIVDRHGALRVDAYIAGDVRDSELYVPQPAPAPAVVDPEMPPVQGVANVVERVQQGELNEAEPVAVEIVPGV